MRDSNLSIFIFDEARYDLMSCNQYVSFYLGKNTLVEQVWIYQPRHVLSLASQHSTVRLRSERGSSSFSSSEDCSGLNMVWMTNKDVFLARSTHFGSQLVMVMMP